jgi:hypothetical protein
MAEAIMRLNSGAFAEDLELSFRCAACRARWRDRCDRYLSKKAVQYIQLIIVANRVCKIREYSTEPANSRSRQHSVPHIYDNC